MTHSVDQLERCYPSNWKGLIVPQAMSHPAKFSSKLIRRIYEHMLEENWLRVGDTVIDPFGGVALGALEAMRHGMNWMGIELEPKFVDLGTQNIAFWNKRFSSMPHWGSAVLLQSDSRFILKVLDCEHTGAMKSPPYADSMGNAEKSGIDWGKQADRESDHPHGWNGAGYSQAAVSSPPYSPEVVRERGSHLELARMEKKGYKPKGSAGMSGNVLMGESYGSTPGQLGVMYEGNFQSAVSSPPFRHSEGGTPEPKEGGSIDKAMQARHAAGNSAAEGYGVSETFWSAARQIVEQVYLALAPGAHAVWVVKDYVKNKQRVPFSDQWRQLCESVGFVTLHEHHAQLVHNKGASHTLEGGVVNHVTESKSFFRRLAEKKGSPRIDYETVFCMIKEAQ